MKIKQCTKCKRCFPATTEYFNKDKSKFCGLRPRCKGCRIEDGKLYRKKYPVRIKENKCKQLKKHQLKYKERNHRYYIQNIKKISERTKQYYENHKKERNQYIKNKIQNNPQFRLNFTMANNIRKSLKGNKAGRHWEDIVGYTLQDLRKHLKKQFDKNMDWNNYGSYWTIDHIIPISIFNFKTFNNINFKECWNLNNLRPLEKIKNIKKSDKLIEQFQQYLAIEVK